MVIVHWYRSVSPKIFQFEVQFGIEYTSLQARPAIDSISVSRLGIGQEEVHYYLKKLRSGV